MRLKKLAGNKIRKKYIRDDNLSLYDFCDFEKNTEDFIKNNSFKYFALVCIQVKNLEVINDIFWTSKNEEIAQFFKKIIKRNIGGKDESVFSFAVGSFAFGLGYEKRTDILKKLERINDEITQSKTTEEKCYSVTVSAGIYTTDLNESVSVREMVDRGFIALRRCEALNRRYNFYSPEMLKAILKEAEVVKLLDSAFKNKEFKIFLQPQHNIQKNDIVFSAEALVRWIKDDGVTLGPNEFIPILEKNGYIYKLDKYVMNEVCEFISKNLNKDWYNNLKIAVNVSKADLNEYDFLEYYIGTKKKYNIPDGLIEIEFTETIVFDDYSNFKYIVSELKRNGFICSIDDFGAGTSSLNVIKELPVDVFKMDRGFFINNDDDDLKKNNSVIASIVAMAKRLGMKIIAEGIESAEQIDFLREIGCDTIQGYVYSKPLKTSEFVDYIKNFKPREADKKAYDIEKRDLKNDLFNYHRYMNTLEFNDSLILDLNIDNNIFNIEHIGKDEKHIFDLDYDFSNAFENIAENKIHSDYKDEFKKIMSIENIEASYCRGDEKIYYEFYADFANKSEYEKYFVNIYFAQNTRKANIFISKV